jgi:hypothetical protein
VSENVKLSWPQFYALQQAAQVLETDNKPAYLLWRLFIGEAGWFYPQHHETARVFIRWQTAASLCGKGLMEYKTVGYRKVKGDWRPENAYRISEAGLKLLGKNL